jgi:hypothetical protein
MNSLELYGERPPERWLFLIHQIPAKPAYLRVKIWRRLQALGAVAIKNAVYALPLHEHMQEDFEWLAKEIVEGGGEAMICEARLIDGLSGEEMRAMFNAARDQDYEALAKEARVLDELLRHDPASAARVDPKIQFTKLKARAGHILSIDFFGANSRETLDGLLGGLEEIFKEDDIATASGSAPGPRGTGDLKSRTWVTRQGVHVDRIASAWLIRRFIDEAAAFKFVPGKAYVPEAGELRFDMFDAEFTHVGDRCTFEGLVLAAGLIDPALQAIAEIVHDIDLKDAKFGREQTPGISQVISGICISRKDDLARIERGAALFDDLYEYFREKRS